VVNIPAEDPICAGTPTLLDPGSGFSSYFWSDGSTSSTITVQDEGIYWVMVTDNNGCPGSDTVRVEPCEVMPEMFAPNAFTPDGDSRNDRFNLVCSSPESLTGFELIIFNRWGQQIFRTKDIGEGWDGTIDGKPCQGDVFPYIVNYAYDVDGGGSKQITGTVTLIR
jgi:gliding motility-associated-like protein